MRILVVGLGSMGKRRIGNLQQLGVEEVRGFDVRKDRTVEVNARFNIRCFSDFSLAMQDCPDALVISTPPDLHTQYAIAATMHGMHFFTEASVVSDGMDMLAKICKDSPIIAAPSCTMRFNPAIQKIKDYYQRNPIAGFTYHVGQYLPDWHPDEDYRDYYVSKRETGACREIVAFELCWLTDVFGKVSEVYGLRDKRSGLHTPIDDTYQIIIKFQKSSVLGHLLVDVVSREYIRHFMAFGEESTIEWKDDGGIRIFKENVWVLQPMSTQDMYLEEMRLFLNCTKNGRPWPYSVRDDINNLELLRRIENE